MRLAMPHNWRRLPPVQQGSVAGPCLPVSPNHHGRPAGSPYQMLPDPQSRRRRSNGRDGRPCPLQARRKRAAQEAQSGSVNPMNDCPK
jgi:hypothetical protein